MSNRKEYEMLWQLNAQLGGNFNAAFQKAQKELAYLQKEMQSLSKTQSDISSYQKQQSAIEATRSKLATLQQQYDNIQKEIKETEGFSSSLENKLLSKQQQIDKTSASLQRQTDSLNRLGASLKEAGVNTDNLASETSELSAKMDSLKGKQVAIIEGAEEFGEVSVGAFDAVSGAIATAGIGKSLKEITEMYAECINASMEFESAMTGVSKTTDMSEGELAAMAEEIKFLSTEIPITTTELAEVAEVAGQLGIVKEDLIDFSTIMSMLATATTMSADEAATLLAQFANITRMDPAYYSNLASTIVDLGNNYATTEQKITEMAQGIAASASLAGMSEADMVALSAAVTSLGIETAAGSTSMSKLITEIMTAVETGENLNTFASIANMNGKEFTQMWGENAVQALQAFVVGLSDTERNGMSATAALSELGITEARMQRMVLSLSNSGDLLNRTLDTANNAWKQNTALTAEAEKRYATTQSKLTMMQNSYNNVKVAIGEGLTPEMQGLYAIATDILNGTADAIEQHPSLMKAGTAFIGLLGTATTGMLAYASAKKVVKALELGSLILNPVTGGIAAVAAVTAGIIGIADAYEEAQIAARNYGDEVTNAAEEYKRTMSEADELETQIGSWKSLNETIASGTTPIEEVNAAKEQLKETEQWLIDNYGIYMDNDGTVSDEEIASLEARNEELRETARLKAEIELYDAQQNYEDAKERVGNKQEKRDKLSAEIKELTKEQYILSKFSTRYNAVVKSKDYENASYAEQDSMRNEVLNGLHAELQKIGINDYYDNNPQNMYAQLDRLESQIEKKREKENKLNEELLELSESRAEYINALNDIFDLEMSDIPTDDLKEFAEVAKFIGEQSAGAELEAAALERYAEQLTEIAHAAGLLPENQSIIFNADGSLNVLEMIAGELTNLDGQSAEITVNANSDTATIKINDILYKVLEYDSTTGVATLSIDGKNATGQLDLLTGEIHTFNESEAEAYLNANTDDFDTNIKNAKEELNALDGKKVTITTVFKSVYQTVKQALGFDGYATGTESAVPGAHWVGEHGPELLWFEGGEKVLDAQKSAVLAQNHINASRNIFSANLAEPLSAKITPNHSFTPIEIHNTFAIEGNATQETIDALEQFADKFRTIVRDELEEISVDRNRSSYI